NCHDTRLDGLADGLAPDDAGGDFLDRKGGLAFDRSFAVNGLAEHVHYAAQQPLADGHLQQFAGGADLIALVDLGIVAQNDCADLGFPEVKSPAGDAIPEIGRLVYFGSGETFDLGAAAADFADGTDFFFGVGRFKPRD